MLGVREGRTRSQEVGAWVCGTMGGGGSVADKLFLVRFRSPDLPPQTFRAERAEFQGDHVVLLTSTGTLAAMFHSEIIESWNEIESS